MVWGCLSASQAYASGQYRGQRTFLRFSDLKEFAEDAKAPLPAGPYLLVLNIWVFP